ncbi:S-adenosyl-L-methionine-dependent methyltransferase [Xylaria sp. CBS 124048]|nr:S-adenosyl-L-methionine-dependent methyltransferase [Xylaria sp. CBS 124048]
MSKSRVARTVEAFRGLLDPWLFLALSASFLPGTVTHIVQTHGLRRSLRILASPSRFGDIWFGQFWHFAGPNVRESAAPKVLPLLDGRTTKGRIVDAPTGPGVGGVVIEIGPASGLWVEVFSERHLYEDASATTGTASGTGLPAVRRRDGNGGDGRAEKRANTARSEITRVYGVEPNTSHHAALRRAVDEAGLQGIYEIVPVGIEDLSSARRSTRGVKWEGSIEPGSVDCIVSVLCLCSIPDPKYNIRELYKYLRPGGRWYVYEHVRCEYSWYMRWYQSILNMVWPHLLGGCQLCRQTEKTLREAGHWSSIDVGQPPAEPWYHSLPHILGVFTK